MGTQLIVASGNAVRAALDAWQADGDPYLSGLDDPEFVSVWAAVRHGVTHRADITLKPLYDAMHAEYERRARTWGHLNPRAEQSQR